MPGREGDDPEALTGRDPVATIGGGARERMVIVAESVYKIIELVGTSTDSWEKAAAAAVAKASGSLRDLRIAEVAELDLQIEDGKVKAYRARLRVSFKYED
jgi:dodecin